MVAKTYKIANGPNTSDLSISLFRRRDGDSVYFELAEEDRGVKCFITGAESVLDWNTNTWQLKGCFKDMLLTQKFTARYNTDSRKGTFTVIKENLQ